MSFIGQAFLDLGFDPDEAEVRTRLYVCYQSLEKPMFPELSLKKRRAMIKARIDLLTRH